MIFTGNMFALTPGFAFAHCHNHSDVNTKTFALHMSDQVDLLR